LVTVLCYHTYDSALQTPFTLSSQQFDRQLRFLQVQKIPVIPLRDLVDHIKEGKPLPPQSAVITIDDGYKTARTVAWPILERYGFPFTLYVYPNAINRFPSAMTWADIKIMSDAGVDIQSHAYTHPLLTHPPKAMTKAEYTAWLKHELRDSRETLEKHTGKPVKHLAYPYGGYDQFVVEQTKAAGYESATTCDVAQADNLQDPLMIPRKLVYRTTSMKNFAKYFYTRNLELADRGPLDGQRLDRYPTEIRAKLLNPQDINPKTLQIKIDKLGPRWHGMRYDPKTQEIHFKMPPRPQHGFFFLTMAAHGRQNPRILHEASWLFLVKKPTAVSASVDKKQTRS